MTNKPNFWAGIPMPLSKLIFIGMIAMFAACDHDSDSDQANPEVSFQSYVITSASESVGSDPSEVKVITTGNLQNGKLFSETVETLIDGVGTAAPQTTQTHFYNGNLLISQKDNNGSRIRDFYYDSQNQMIGAKMTITAEGGSGTIYYRFTHPSDLTVYFERTTLPYDDPAAVIMNRNIITFDSEDNIVTAGTDANLDGVVENQNVFSYVDNNLASIAWYNGTVQNFDYSNVIDNFSVLKSKSYGKRNLRITESEGYLSPDQLTKFQSHNILAQELADNVYDVLSTNFYKKRTVTKSINEWQNTTTTEFFFN